MREEKRYTPSVSLKESERKWLKKMADEEGISYTRYIKEVALCKRSQAGQKIGKENRLKQLLTELNRIGTNINQIAKVANKTGSLKANRFKKTEQEFASLKLKILEELQ